MSINWRVPVGFLLAPAAPCAIYVLTMAAIAGQWNGAVFIFWALTATSIGTSLAIALPIYLLLNRYWKVRLIECLLGGAGTALLLNLVLFLVIAYAFPERGYSAGDSGGDTIVNGKYTQHGMVQVALGVIQSMFFGATIGICFWFIALYRPVTKRA